MINNRQQNGRRRGRGGERPQNTPNRGPNPNARLDNRARGNASQLHEKYKALARDMQTQGDRVATEYYLQFADHYFRVLSESRARFEEQRPRDRQWSPNDGYGDEGDEGYDADGAPLGEGDDGDEPRRQDRGFDDNRGQRQPRQPDYAAEDGQQQQQPRRNDRGYEDNRGQRQPPRQAEYAGEDEARPRRAERPYEDNNRRPRPPQQLDFGNEDGSTRRVEEGRRPYQGEQSGDGGQRARRPQRGTEDGRIAAPPAARAPEPVREAVIAAPVPTPAPAPVPVEQVAEAPRRGRPRKIRPEETEEAPRRIEIDRLPPAFAAPGVEPAPVANGGETAEAAPRRRGRPRKIRPEDGNGLEA